MHQEVPVSVPSNPPTGPRVGPVAVESVPPKISVSGCSRRGSWPARLLLARLRPGVWFRMTEPLTKSSASQMASDLRNSYRRRLESLRMSGVAVGERWEAEYGNDPSDPDVSHFYVWFRLVSPAPVSTPVVGVN